MDKRARSPNYPALSLRDAIDRCALIYRNQHTHAAPREVVVKSMGFAGINGASATAFSALLKYGLLERSGEDTKLSERAMQILHPHGPDEKVAALRKAAYEPPLFQELADRFPGPLPAEEVIRNYLIRKGFAPVALSTVILAYRETMDLVAQGGGAYDSEHAVSPPEAPMSLSSRPETILGRSYPADDTIVFRKEERSLGRHDFEDGSYVRIGVHGDLDTEDALAWAEVLIENKRRELKMRARRVPVVITEARNERAESERDA